MDCCDEVTAIQVLFGWGADSFSLLATLFITGLTGSFTHCIGMCGPIAVNQMSIRLLHTDSHSLTEIQKIKCAASIPYYIGKAITYSLLASISVLFVSAIKNFVLFHYIGALLLLLAALFFIGAAFSSKFSLLKWLPLPNIIIKISNWLQKRLINRIGKFNLSPFGYTGWLMGLTLGFLPCGLVYAAIATVLAYTDNLLLASLSMFLFGMGTIPALFIVSYLGEYVIIKNKKLFSAFYFLSMVINSFLLLKAALKMIIF